MLTQAVQDYLKVIYKLGRSGQPVATNAIAKHLRAAPASVTKMLRRMKARGLIRHTPYRGVRLTTEGERAALEVIRHHRLLELFLMAMLGMRIEQAHAGRAAGARAVREPGGADRTGRGPSGRGPSRGSDPHAPGGGLGATHPRLSEVPVGPSLVVARVRDSGTGVLGRIAQLGLLPGCEVSVVGRQAGGRIRLRLRSGDVVSLPRRMAESTFVEVAG